MSKGIRNYSKAEQLRVVARRVRNYEGKGKDGIGTLAAKDFQNKYKGNLSLAGNAVTE